MLKSKLKAMLQRRNNVTKSGDISPRPKPSTLNIAAQLSSPSPASEPATLAGNPSLVSTAIENSTNLGLHTVHETAQRQDAIVDIIFVHGLTGNSHGTWFDAKSGVHWPSTVLADDVLDARIFCFGYDADITSFWGHSSRNRLAEHAKALMGDVVHEREETDTQTRHIIFIAHSLGGLVVEKALSLSRSRSEAHLKQLEQYTIGIVFLGTPHHGSDLAAWAVVCAKFVSRFKDTNLEILNVLKPESEVLRDTQDEFGQLLESRKYEDRKIHITCFYEELAMSIVGQVVPASSAGLLGYDSYGIHADHAGMARFSNSTDIGYKRVVGEIKRWVRQLRTPAVIQTSVSKSLAYSETQEECLCSLHYEDMFFRRDTVLKASSLTFHWIWYRDDLGFREWLRTGRDIFWITGKPGSGKSTLLKYISDPIRVNEELKKSLKEPIDLYDSPIIITHFFQHSVGSLPNTVEGLLRSLLWQILCEDVSLFRCIEPIFLQFKRATGSCLWTRRELEKGLSSVFRTSLRHLCIFIDALDEYGGEDAEIAGFLNLLAKDSPSNVRFCVTSRPYPDFTFQFVNAPTFRIHDHTHEDISIFLQRRFHEVVARPGRADYYDLMTYIRENSNGVFLWVKLMCDELQRGWGNWDNAMQLQERLKKMPQDLDSMYRRIMETMKREDRDEASRMLAIVSSAARPLSLPEFYHALVYSSATCKRTTRLEKNIHCKYGFPHDLLFDLEVKERSPQYASVKIALEGRIDAICRGMLFVQHGRVRLLHETVEEFFRGAIGWLVESSFTLPSLNGDDLLLRACINYQIGLFECNPPFTWSVRPTGKPNSQEDIKTDDVYIDGEDYRSYHATHSWHLRDNVPLKLSFLLYAVDNWLSHAYKVEKITQRAQNDLIESFYGHSFIIWRHLFGIHHPRQRQTLPLKLIHLIIESGLDLTAEKILQAAVNGQETVCSKELEGYQNKNHLLFSVAKGGCYSVAESVFSLGATFQNPNNNELPMQSNSTGLHMKVEALNRRALHRAIHSGHLALVDLFVHKGADLESEIESKALEQLSNLTADFGVSHLKEFRSKSHYKLSDYGTLQRSNARRSSFLGKTREGKFWSSRALEFAVLCDKKEIFLTLLSYYSEIGQQESLLLALTAAAFKGRIYYIRELLDRGVNPNLPVQRSQGCFILGTHTCYPILPAIYWGYLDIVELLITRGADLNVQAESDYCGRHMPGKKLYSGRPSTPHQVASDRLSKYPSNQMYVDMLSLLEKSGAGLTSNGTKHDMILEELND